MKNVDEILRRLFRAAAWNGEAEPQMPFGFDTRVLAMVRDGATNGSVLVALFARRAVAISLAIIVLAGAGVYSASQTARNAELTNEYGIADNAIQSNLSE